jgi:hypothetical protein
MLQLNVSSAAGLNINTSSVAFGNVPVNSPQTQSITLTASGLLPITVGLATVAGNGFSLSNIPFPIILTQGQSATLDVSFNPTAAGAATGQLIIASTALLNGTAVVNLSGTGVTVEVNLSWDAPSSSDDPVSGYNVYRSGDLGGSYQLLNTTAVTQTAYMDTSALTGLTYEYIVKSVDAEGVESAPSNTTTVAIP